MSIKSYIYPQIIGSKTSKYNKKIEVVEYFGKKSLKVNNLTQSGPVVEDIYRKILPILPMTNTTNNINVLILGFGAGSFARLIRQKLPKCKITGVEIDKIIINIANDYFKVNEIKNLKVVCDDAVKFVEKNFAKANYRNFFDIIFVDLYIGEQIEKQVETSVFLKHLRSLLSGQGMVIFNRLNYKQHRKENENFIKLLAYSFNNISSKQSYSNLIVYAGL